MDGWIGIYVNNIAFCMFYVLFIHKFSAGRCRLSCPILFPQTACQLAKFLRQVDWETGSGKRCYRGYITPQTKAIWMFPKIGGFYPQIIHVYRVFHYFHHPFWGANPYFWKHPYISGIYCQLGDHILPTTF